MAKIKALIVSGNGTNCERETAFACSLAGADLAEIVPIWELIAGQKKLVDYNLLCLPGGFMDGDDLGAARASAMRYMYAKTTTKEGIESTRLWDDVKKFVEDDKLIFGICNGFQLVVKLGLLPNLESKQSHKQTVTLTHNDSGRFEDRWVDLLVDPKSPCIFTKGIETLQLPVRHGEGKLVCESEELYQNLQKQYLIPVSYANPKTLEPTEDYPENPNGSKGGSAGLCDSTGRVFGLMPHPECYLHKTHHPRWTRLNSVLPEEGMGLRLFKNAVDYLR